jgi:hypothetical protein
MVMFTKIIVTFEKLIPIIKNNLFYFILFKKKLGRNYDHGFFNQLLKNIQEMFFGYFVGCCCAQIVIVCKNIFLFKQFRVF